MAILADLKTKVHRRLPKPFYIRREDGPHDQAMDVHSGSQQWARSRVNDDGILPSQRTLRLEAALEAIPGMRARIVDQHDTSVLEQEPATMRPSPIVKWPVAHRRPRPRKMYQMQPGHEDGPIFNVFERSTGLLLGKCQGVHEHVRREAELLAVSQGQTLADIQIEVA